MHNLPVHWYEGLFVRPHHFQAADRYWSENLQTWGQFDNPYNYGLFGIEFSRDALANHQFEVQRLQARMRDGTLINFAVGDEPDRVAALHPELARIGLLENVLEDDAAAVPSSSSDELAIAIPVRSSALLGLQHILRQSP